MKIQEGLRRRATALAHDETGAVVVIVALMLVALLGIAALVIDAGGLYDRDLDLQAAADAAALAGAQELIFSGRSATAAETEAHSYIDKNAAVSDVVVANLGRRDVVVGGSPLPSWVEVDLREDDIPLSFAPVIGHDTGSVTAHARAEIKALIGVRNLFPVTAQYYVARMVLRLTNRATGATAGPFELTEGSVSGGYTQWAANFPANMGTGLWDATLECLDSGGNVYARYINISVLNVLADPNTSYVSSVTRSNDGLGDVVVVEAAAPPLVVLPQDISLGATQGQQAIGAPVDTGSFTPEGLKLWRWTLPTGRVVVCPSQVKDYDVQSLSLQIGSGSAAVTYSNIARFPDFHRDGGAWDVPVVSFTLPAMVRPGAGVTVRTRVKTFQYGEYFPLKVASNFVVHGGGSRRTANVFRDIPLVDEITGAFLPDSRTWAPYYPPLVIDGKLDTAGEQVMGVSGGVIRNGWDARVATATTMGWDGTRLTAAEIAADPSPVIPHLDPGFIIVPIVYWRNTDGAENITYSSPFAGSVSLTKDDYRIAAFVGYYVVNPPTANNSDIGGYFIRAVAQGEWDPDYDPDPNDLSVQIAVLTE